MKKLYDSGTDWGQASVDALRRATTEDNSDKSDMKQLIALVNPRGKTPQQTAQEIRKVLNKSKLKSSPRPPTPRSTK